MTPRIRKQGGRQVRVKNIPGISETKHDAYGFDNIDCAIGGRDAFEGQGGTRRHDADEWRCNDGAGGERIIARIRIGLSRRHGRDTGKCCGVGTIYYHNNECSRIVCQSAEVTSERSAGTRNCALSCIIGNNGRSRGQRLIQDHGGRSVGTSIGYGNVIREIAMHHNWVRSID